MKVESVIAYLSTVSVFAPLVLCIIQWRKLPDNLAALRWVIVTSLLCDILSLLVPYLFSVSPTIFGNLYLFIQFTLLIYIFSFYHKKITLIVVYFLFLVFYFANFLFFQKFTEFQTNSNVVTSLILILLSLRYLYRLLSELPTIHIQKVPMLWLTFAVLIYYAGTLFLFLANNYLIEMFNNDYIKLWILHNFFNITKNILFTIALWKQYQMLRSSTLS